MGSFNATSVGLERMVGILKHLPFAIDELQMLNSKRLSVENIIYSFGNEFVRLKSFLTRALELYEKPLESVDAANQLHLISENNYGFAVRIFSEYLMDTVLRVKGKISRNFNGLRSEFEKRQAEISDNTHSTM